MLVRLKVIIIMLLAIIMSACSTYQAIYDIQIIRVESGRMDIIPLLGRTVILPSSSIVPEAPALGTYSFADSILAIQWKPSTEGFFFRILNKSQSSIRVNWDNASFVDIKGFNYRIVHEGISYTSRYSSQVPSTIVAGTYLSDVLYPAHYVTWTENGWIEEPLLPKLSYDLTELKSLCSKYIGQHMKVMLPIECNGYTHEYIFVFHIANVRYQRNV